MWFLFGHVTVTVMQYRIVGSFSKAVVKTVVWFFFLFFKLSKGQHINNINIDTGPNLHNGESLLFNYLYFKMSLDFLRH